MVTVIGLQFGMLLSGTILIETVFSWPGVGTWLLGGILGLICGHLLGAAGSAYMRRLMGEGINWLAVGREETLYLGVVVVIAVLAGLVPALKAYRTPVATTLVSG